MCVRRPHLKIKKNQIKSKLMYNFIEMLEP